ncbi:hypothetical protein OUZ56_000663 [Daphnia magna]|uniref:Uncharacterized protein n=1 Tax=Daphnia magna TaxID=35525 RepID=A0ABR0A0C9_9CRUS|nr:hypothetical protein OUZ56_000663 [Daphnia magna]
MKIQSMPVSSEPLITRRVRHSLAIVNPDVAASECSSNTCLVLGKNKNKTLAQQVSPEIVRVSWQKS